jgi:formylglycine-generating enzyme
MQSHQFGWVGIFVLIGAVNGACSSGLPKDDGTGGKASGGAAAKGGATGGGARSTGGNTSVGGLSAIGGSVGLGGATSSGGTSIAAGTSGIASLGGAMASGGVTTAGGAVITGGNLGTGGATTTGGSSATGGRGGGGALAGAASTVGGASNAGASGKGSYGIPSQSCSGASGTECNGESCCVSLPVPAGTFPMGRGTETCSNCIAGCPGGMTCDIDETPEHPVTVSAFSLDKYEVTVGRFRRFVDAYDKIDTPPPTNSGAHPSIPGTGWQVAWNGQMPADAAAFKTSLKCDTSYQSWTDSTANKELYPINCVNWYQALAFCVWDGGRLPTEAEWEYVAAGGDENRIYPWGSTPAPSCSLGNYYTCVGLVAPVGGYISGQGRWGHLDLAGNMYEWTSDWYSNKWYSDALATGTDVANVTSSSARVVRGGGWGSLNTADFVRAAARSYPIPTYRTNHVGFRCARSLQ